MGYPRYCKKSLSMNGLRLAQNREGLKKDPENEKTIP